MAVELTIMPSPNTNNPVVIFGFSSGEFSQCVYLNVDTDPLACVEMANNIAEQFVNACAAAVKAYNNAHPSK